MADTDKSLKLGVEVDEASLKRAKQRLEDIEKAQNELRSEFLRGAKSADAYSKELSALEKEASVLNKTLDALEKPREIDVKTDRFDKVSRDVSLAGDAESNLRTIGGGIGAIGGDFGAGIERAIGTLAEFPATIEAIPRAFEGFKALPQTVSAAAGAIGAPGGAAGLIGGIAGIGAVIAVGAVAFSVYSKEAEKAREVQKAYTESLKETIGLLSSEAGTSDAVSERRTELERELEVAQRTADALRQVRDVRNEENNALQDIFNQSRVLAAPTRKQLNEDITAADTAVRGAEASIEAFNFALDETEIAANDAAAAEKALAASRTEGVLTEASQAGELASLKARATELTREQIDAELQSLEVRRAGLEAEIAALESSGDTSTEVADKIAQLREELGFLGETSETLKNAQKTAKSSEAEKAAQEAEQERTKSAEAAAQKQEQSAQKAQQAADEARRAQDSYTQAVKDAKQGYMDAVKDIGTRLKDTFIDNNQKLEDTLNEQAIKFNESELTEEAAYRHELAKIRRDAERAEKDAVRQRDFAAVADVRENRDDALDDREDAEEFSNAQQLDAFKQQQDALGRERERADRDALVDAERARRDAATARDRQLRDARSTYDAALRDQQNFGQQFTSNMKSMFDNVLKLQSSTGGSGRTSSGGTTSGRTANRVNAPTNFDDLQYVVGGGR